MSTINLCLVCRASRKFKRFFFMYTPLSFGVSRLERYEGISSVRKNPSAHLISSTNEEISKALH